MRVKEIMMKIAISGVGIAGPTLAWWLKKYGFEPVLFEKAESFRTGGYLVDFWGTGCDIAKKMGLFDKFKAASFEIDNIHCFDGRGKKSAKVNIVSLIKEIHGDFLSVKRGDISSIIYNACDGIKTHFNTHITALEESDSDILVHLSNGKKEAFDLVIGADGLHSNTRSLVFDGSEYEEYDLNKYVMAFSLNNYNRHENHTYGICIEDDKQISRVTLENGQTLIMFTLDSNLVDKFPSTLQEKKDLLIKSFHDVHWEIPDILSRLNDVDNIYFDKVSQIRMNNWHKGRVALVGDAAACPSILMGQGSIFAMIETYILAGELYKAKGNHVVAFEAWQNQLKEIIEQKQKLGLMNLSTAASSDLTKKYLSKITLEVSATPVISKFIGAGIFTDKIILPDYK